MLGVMGTVHDILEAQGRQATLQLDFDRQVVEAAAAYMADEDGGIGFLYSGWCQAALPHRRLPDHKGWQVTSDRFCLIVEPGMRRGSGDEPVHVGVPYGSRARLILIYLQSEALRTGSREITLGKSLRDWMGRMGIPVGGWCPRGSLDENNKSILKEYPLKEITGLSFSKSVAERTKRNIEESDGTLFLLMDLYSHSL